MTQAAGEVRAADGSLHAVSRVGRLRSFVQLTKPRIIELLLVTTVPVMLLAQRGWPEPRLIVAVLVGGACCAGAANALNMVIDRDIDAVMDRTRHRPLVTGAVSARAATWFALVLAAAGAVLLGVAANWLSAVLAVCALLFYVFVYTIWLKRRTSQNVIWGGIAGCLPVLIGWSSVTGGMSVEPLALFGLVFLWTPAHHWPLSMQYAADYRSAEVPMLGAVRAPQVTARRALLWGIATAIWAALLTPLAGLGWLYPGVAVLAGVWFVAQCAGMLRRVRRRRDPRPMAVFHASIVYLSAVFIAIGMEAVLPR